jgi:tRNA A37 methylthiotransferase MiaB
LDLQQQLAARYSERLQGRMLDVLVEGVLPDSGRLLGTACRYLPVELPGTPQDVGQFLTITAGRLSGGRLRPAEI